MRKITLVGAVEVCLLAACSDDGVAADPFGSASAEASGGTGAPTSVASDDPSTAPSSLDASDSATAASTTEDVKFDVGTLDDLPVGACNPDEQDCGCSAVDILFIVDNSGSMQEHAAPTIAAFDTFVNEMITALPVGTSLHVGVTRATGFFDPGNSGGWGSGSCEGFSDGAWNPPDVANNATNGQQGRLYEHEAQRYFDLDTDLDPQPLKTWFQGALMGAIASDDHSNTETVVAGAAYPFHPANADFNDSFMRQQGVLVLFLLSDSPDLSPVDIPTTEFIDIVSDAKSECGDMCIITTGAIAGDCYENAMNTNTRLTDFMNGFGQPPPSWVPLASGVVPNFEGVLGSALAEVIGSTCENIPPAG